MRLRIKESNSNTFDKDKSYIENIFSALRIGSVSQIPFNRFSDDAWRQIVSDVRSIVEVENADTTIEDSLFNDGYNNPDDELFNWIRDILDDIDEKGHDSRFEQYANTVSLLMYGENYWW